ncbi:MAG: c-type cytochrome [Croceibacterium sp.]
MRGPKHAEAIAMLACLGALAACKQPPEARYVPDSRAMERGLAAIERVGCAACHEIPGLDWPQGRNGPSLAGFDDVGAIAGALPNTAENLAAFVRNAPAAKPGSTMPAMPLSEEEARDVAAYLYGMSDA